MKKTRNVEKNQRTMPSRCGATSPAFDAARLRQVVGLQGGYRPWRRSETSLHFWSRGHTVKLKVSSLLLVSSFAIIGGFFGTSLSVLIGLIPRPVALQRDRLQYLHVIADFCFSVAVVFATVIGWIVYVAAFYQANAPGWLAIVRDISYGQFCKSLVHATRACCHFRPCSDSSESPVLRPSPKKPLQPDATPTSNGGASSIVPPRATIRVAHAMTPR